MQDGCDPLDLIGPLLPRLEALGLSDLAERLGALGEPRAGGASAPVGLPDADLLSPAAAAEMLGLRSATTVRGLVESGELEGYWAADGLVIARRSAEAYRDSPRLASQRRLEEQIWSALDDLL